MKKQYMDVPEHRTAWLYDNYIQEEQKKGEFHETERMTKDLLVEEKHWKQ